MKLLIFAGNVTAKQVIAAKFVQKCGQKLFPNSQSIPLLLEDSRRAGNPKKAGIQSKTRARSSKIDSGGCSPNGEAETDDFRGKVAEKASNTFMYTAVVVGVGLIGAFVYVLAGEFFAQDSPQTIFNKALSLVREDGRCQDMFGPSIAGFGEETARGRRRHVAHHKYEKDGMQRIRVLFHVKGDRDEGIAQAEMEQRDGDWQWRFLYVETKRRPKTTHVLIDNR